MAVSTGGDAQRYKFSGKELIRDHGIDWYDHGARWYDATAPTWHTMDPLCEKKPGVTPYMYCASNPVRYNDPLYMHEYGHYLQSQEYGWGYLVSVGVPSLMSAINSKSLDDPPFSTHNFFWAEISANKKAKNYFENRYDISWNDLVSHRYNKWYHIYELYPLSSPY